MICLDWIDNHAEALGHALEGESIYTPFLHARWPVAPMAQRAGANQAFNQGNWNV